MKPRRFGFFKSIRFKIIAPVMAAIVLLTAFFTYIAINQVDKISDENAIEVMNLLCKNETAGLNEQLLKVEYSVDVMATFVYENVPSDEEIDADPTVLDEHMDVVGKYLDSIAKINPEIVSYYYNYKPLEMVAGYWMVDDDGNGTFARKTVTDLSQYDEDDTNHTAWYYIPANAKTGVWLDPYYNSNFNMYIISYEIPLIDDNGAVYGIVGMDLNLYSIIEDVLDVSVYDTGSACLLQDDGTVICHKDIKMGTNIILIDAYLYEFVEALYDEDSEGELFEYTYDDEVKEMAFCSLRNGLKFVLTVPESEIYADEHAFLNKYISISIVCGIVFLLLASIICHKILSPLLKLTNAARDIGDGKDDVVFPEDSNDEIGILSETMQSMQHKMRQTVEGLYRNANQDALTGVGNKRAYLEYCKGLDEGKEKFGIVMFDVNYLKKVNDECGHAKGDIYLNNNCELIAGIFRACPMYRIGGDEFVVILPGSQTDKAQYYFKEMDMRAEQINQMSDNLWDRIDVARGYAEFDPEKDAFIENISEAVAKKADEEMYKDKAGKRRT